MDAFLGMVRGAVLVRRRRAVVAAEIRDHARGALRQVLHGRDPYERSFGVLGLDLAGPPLALARRRLLAAGMHQWHPAGLAEPLAGRMRARTARTDERAIRHHWTSGGTSRT